MAFHEIQFPTGVSKGSSGGPMRLTDIVTLRSGYEQRNTIWSDSRRRYDAGLGLQDIQDLYEVLQFFEARRGRLHGFRWKDWADYKSLDPIKAVSNTDVSIGTGDGSSTDFQLTKTYSDSSGSYVRTIKKPVDQTVLIAIDGVDQEEISDFTVDLSTGIVTFSSAPSPGTQITSGFEFDVSVRFDMDSIMVNVEQFNAGAIPTIDIVEIKV